MFDKKKLQNIVFWSIPVFIFLVQFIFTISSTSQIRYEELAESVRNVFWLQNKTIYDGISSNVGWYGTLLLIYNFFGFTLNSTKFFRLILDVFSILSLVFLLKKYLGKHGWLPLLAIGLSPVFLYFNTFQTSFGIDLQYLLICLFLLEKIDLHGFRTDLRGKVLNQFGQIVLWGLVMVAWMSYPTFVFYIPALSILYVSNLRSLSNLNKIKNLIISFFSFVSPFLIALIYLKDKSLFLFDPITKAGVFRGSGSMQFDWKIFSKNISSTLGDIFSKGNSYNFELTSPDFSNYYPAIAVIFVLIFGILLIIQNKSRFIVILSFFTLFFSLVFSNLALDPTGMPGIRRNTPILASFYAIFIISWFYFVRMEAWNKFFLVKKARYLIIIIFLLIPIHHVLVIPQNLESIKSPSHFQYAFWMGIADTPENSLKVLLNNVSQKDFPISCKQEGRDVFCRYSETYAAIAGSCLWNKLSCKNISGFDPKTKKFIPLSTNLWETNYWEH